MLFGFFIAGLLHVFLKKEQVYAFLGKGKVKSVFLSSLIGIPLPLCSCSVVPAAAGIKKQGANQGATVAFLISTPETGVDSISITYALMDPLMTIMRPISALFTGFFAGLAENLLPHKKERPVSQTIAPIITPITTLITTPTIAPSFEQSISAETSCVHCCVENQDDVDQKTNHSSFIQRFVMGLKYAYIELPKDIGKWFIIGILLSGMILYFVPENFMNMYIGNRFVEMLIMMLSGIPMYVCATASTPIAAALIAKGMDPGAALVFLLVGPATNIASLTMIAGLLGKRSLIIYLGSIIIFSFIFGILTSEMYDFLSIQAVAYQGHESHLGNQGLALIASIILMSIFIYGIISSQLKKGVKK